MVFFITYEGYLWPNTICDPTLFVAQHYLWPNTICGPALFVAQHYLWPNTTNNAQTNVGICSCF